MRRVAARPVPSSAALTGRRVSVDFYEARVQRMCQCARPSAVLFDPMRLVYTQTNSPALPE